MAAAFVAIAVSGTLFGHGDKKHAKKEETGVPKTYPLKKCVVSDDPFDHGKAIMVSSKGTDVYLCCKECVKDFNADPEKFTKMVTDTKPPR